MSKHKGQDDTAIDRNYWFVVLGQYQDRIAEEDRVLSGKEGDDYSVLQDAQRAHIEAVRAQQGGDIAGLEAEYYRILRLFSKEWMTESDKSVR